MQTGKRNSISQINAQIRTSVNAEAISEGFQRPQNLAQVIRGRSRRSKSSALYFSGGSSSDIETKDVLIVLGVLIGVFAGVVIFALIVKCATGKDFKWRKNHS
ncbi:UNKNOWN [Stylonychia lemnae]|uniref:Uncharacterized protein n=1 Tax=Stylonychia lemnae TaxID=5949 RepID=A0A078AY91_STYLE|nr:UNKNOWN [Stylonychia lemnae]|eukprot:CDW87370.1 UNKNOWN [Stylonychia lemnae]